MKLFVVTYRLRNELVRAFLKLNSQDEIFATLSLYHGIDRICIKKIKEIDDNSRFIYVQYFD